VRRRFHSIKRSVDRRKSQVKTGALIAGEQKDRLLKTGRIINNATEKTPVRWAIKNTMRWW
jgi:UDP-N-acetylglucosamine pyrophosphorylase